MPRPKQTEMKGKGFKRDAVGNAAKKFLKARDAIEEAKSNLEAKSEALVKIMRKHKRKEIKVEGVTITLRHMEAQDLLKVRKPKQQATGTWGK